MTAAPKSAVVIPQKRHTELTQRLVEQVGQFEPRVGIFVVNDDPGDNPSFDGVTVLANAGSGVTAAWNTGVAAADAGGAAHVVLLNNDVICTGPFIPALIEAGDDGIAGAADRFDPIIRRPVLEGWCLAFSVACWRNLGGFDESMTLYFSDTEFQARAVQAGLQLRTVNVPLQHLGHRTAHDPALVPNRRDQWTRDRDRFLALHSRDRSTISQF